MELLIGEKAYKLGDPLGFSGTEGGKTITFVLTQDCNLACGYCYMVGKNRDSRMSVEVAKKAVDFILDQDYDNESVTWDFIGGEPLLEIGLLEEICAYIQTELYLRNHKWFNNYSFSISTNGTLYRDPRVQQFIQKHRNHLNIGITIDGNREKHDMHRKFPNGKGSYDLVEESVRLWVQQFPEASTKVTFSSGDLPYLKDSIIHLWDLGIKNVAANVVFEDVWQEGDDGILERQLKDLADYALESGRWRTHSCSFFSDAIGQPLTEDLLDRNWCGSGHHMLAIDFMGHIYPCVRFMDYSLSHQKGIVLGDVITGIDADRCRPFCALTAKASSPAECLTCPVAMGCAWCQGYNYDVSTEGTIYSRSTAICRMHKARVRANDYYFAKLARVEDKRIAKKRPGTLFIITAEDSAPVCSYQTKSESSVRMSDVTFKEGLRFAAEQLWFPIIIQPEDGPLFEMPAGTAGWAAVSSERYDGTSDIVVYDNSANRVRTAPTAVLILDRGNIQKLSELTERILPVTGRTVLVLRNTHTLDERDLADYELELQKVSDQIHRLMKRGMLREFSALTDRLYLDHLDDCGAGRTAFALAPNGRLYICPAFYFADPESSIGSLEDGVDYRKLALCDQGRAPVCSDCSAYHCRRCLFANKAQTGEINVSPRSQCVLSHVELRQSSQLQNLTLEGPWTSQPFTVECLDPLVHKLMKTYGYNTSGRN